MSSLTAIFGSAEDKEQDSDKLLNLYWNRAELKKEFAGMRKEQFKLQDLIKQHEGATARLQQKLDYLEDLLTDSEWVHNVVVFYQLRSLAIRCESKLAKFAEQLKQQREIKQHNNLLAKWMEALAGIRIVRISSSSTQSSSSQVMPRRPSTLRVGPARPAGNDLYGDGRASERIIEFIRQHFANSMVNPLNRVGNEP